MVCRIERLLRSSAAGFVFQVMVALTLQGLTVSASAARDCEPERACPGQESGSECASLAKSYESLDTAMIEGIKKEADASLSGRPGMTIEDVLWVGMGKYELQCGGRYPAARPAAEADNPGIDCSHINNWVRGGGSAEEPGTYTFATDLNEQPITEYEATEENLARFGARLTHSGEYASFSYESVHAVYVYKDNYFSDWVMRPGPLGGSRIERHPTDHLFTLAKPLENDAPSYFILGRVENGDLELGAIRLRTGVTILVPANVVHTNDYVKGTLEEVYPRVWGIDEVLLVNRDGKRVSLVPKVKP